jgi:hypothetical protein
MCENPRLENLQPIYGPILTLVTPEKNQILSVNYNCTKLSCVLLKHSVIQKDELHFVRLYFLNYTQYVNDLHNI